MALDSEQLGHNPRSLWYRGDLLYKQDDWGDYLIIIIIIFIIIIIIINIIITEHCPVSPIQCLREHV